MSCSKGIFYFVLRKIVPPGKTVKIWCSKQKFAKKNEVLLRDLKTQKKNIFKIGQPTKIITNDIVKLTNI